MGSGIYQIRNTLNGNRYIGSAVDTQQRWQQHLSMLRHEKHYNKYLQRAFDKYSEALFTFNVLEQVEDTKQLIPREQHYLDTLEPEYNICPTAGSSLGVPCNVEARAKQSAAKIGKQNSFYGKHHSEETRARQSAANIGKRDSAETRAKKSAALTGERNPMYGRTGKRSPNYGKHHSAETRAKIGAANSGERHYLYGKHLSDVTRAKISVANIGKHRNAETRAKMGRPMNGEQNPMYGKHHSKETKHKISKALKASWRRKYAEER